ncbi:MAG: hypothetical protein WC502_09685 [Methanolinea sp.]
MTPAPRPVDSIPETRQQVIALLKHYDWDASELTREQREAVRRLYDLDKYRTIAEVLEGGMHS